MHDVEQLFDPLIALLRGEFGDELLGMLATGSRIHGTPGPTSDLDVHVVIAQPRRQRRNIVLGGVEIEMFINPAFRVPIYFQDRHPGTIHMFAFGRAIYDPHGVVAQLQEQARRLWQAGPPPYAEAELWMPRYAAADMLRDLADLREDEDAASLQIARLVDQLIDTLPPEPALAGQAQAPPERAGNLGARGGAASSRCPSEPRTGRAPRRDRAPGRAGACADRRGDAAGVAERMGATRAACCG
jgi:hypothetical protein